jgi:hypothetical protein
VRLADRPGAVNEDALKLTVTFGESDRFGRHLLSTS